MVCGILGLYVWCKVYGVWCMVYGVWCMVYGVWCMVYGVWCMVCIRPQYIHNRLNSLMVNLITSQL